MSKKLIHIISSNRADFGLLNNLIQELQLNNKFKTKFIVTGNHLQKKFANSIKEISNLKTKIDYKIRINENYHKNARSENNLSKYINKFSDFFNKHTPNLLIVLGDRYELFGICISAAYNNIPIAHISGGEITRGSYDEFNRHCISKLSLLHFTSKSIYKKRLIQLGEHPSRVFNVGNLINDSIAKLIFSSKLSLENKYKFVFNKKNLLITFHPVTNEPNSSKKYIKEILKSLKKYSDIFFIFTSPNSDLGSNDIVKEIKLFIKINNNSIFISSLGHKDYLSTLLHVDAVIGNSSSGLTEVPFFNIPTINLGDRQEGRYLEKTVINCKINANLIIKSINKVYKNKNKYRKSYLLSTKSTSKKIVSILENFKLKKNFKKKFYDLKNH